MDALRHLPELIDLNSYLSLPDSVILFSSLWEDSSPCYHGSERELPVQ